MSKEWEEFFDGHAPVYMDNVFVTNTIEEVDFIINNLELQPGMSILDLGCGTGRHSVELAKRGYKVTGLDLSQGMLDQANKAAEKEGVEVEFIKADATDFHLDKEFDAAIIVCEGAFGLIGPGQDPLEHDLKILQNIHAHLRPGAKLQLNSLNGIKTLREHGQKDIEEGHFDPMNVMAMEAVDGKYVGGWEKGYLPTELKLLMEKAGFEVLDIWGGTAGNWGQRPVELDDWELMATARKD